MKNTRRTYTIYYQTTIVSQTGIGAERSMPYRIAPWIKSGRPSFYPFVKWQAVVKLRTIRKITEKTERVEEVNRKIEILNTINTQVKDALRSQILR